MRNFAVRESSRAIAGVIMAAGGHVAADTSRGGDQLNAGTDVISLDIGDSTMTGVKIDARNASSALPMPHVLGQIVKTKDARNEDLRQ